MTAIILLGESFAAKKGLRKSTFQSRFQPRFQSRFQSLSLAASLLLKFDSLDKKQLWDARFLGNH